MVNGCILMEPKSRSETEYRRPDFLGGLPIRLADGREWAFAGPREVAAAGPALRDEVEGLIAAIVEAEDQSERLLGELSLAVCLLLVNYDLSANETARLLEFSHGDSRLLAIQEGFHDLARRHAEALGPRKEAPAISEGRRFRFPAFLPRWRRREQHREPYRRVC